MKDFTVKGNTVRANTAAAFVMLDELFDLNFLTEVNIPDELLSDTLRMLGEEFSIETL